MVLLTIYADDNTPTNSAHEPNELEQKMQNDGVIIVNWFEKNDMVCSSEKTKLLIIGTNANRKLKLDRFNKKLRINICGELKEEIESEKLLGVLVNNTLTWKDLIFGNEEESGLLKQLSKRIGILKKLRPLMSDKKFQQAVAGLFTSKLIYCITVWRSIWTNITAHQLLKKL